MKSLGSNLLPFGGELYHLPKYISRTENLIKSIKEECIWRDDKIVMFGKSYSQPRRVAWCGDEGITYTYSKIKMTSSGWPKVLKEIRDQIEKDFDLLFNSCLVNWYRDGDDYMSYHSDNELELGDKPTIFSLSLGASRDFLLKHTDTGKTEKTSLEDGDLVIMKGEIQEQWKHSIPKRKNVSTERFNLTFRNINR